MSVGRYLIAGALAVVLAGCGNKAAEAPKADAPAQTAAPAPPPAAPPTKKTPENPAPPAGEPAPAESPEPVRDVNLVRNASFDDWSAEGPAEWVFKPGEVEKNTTEIPGNAVVQLNKGTDYVVLEQIIEPVRQGEQVRVLAKIKAAAPNDATLKVKYRAGDEERTQRWNYKGAGQWLGAQMIITLPPDLKYRSFVVQVLRSPEAQAPVFVDDVAVAVKRP